MAEFKVRNVIEDTEEKIDCESIAIDGRAIVFLDEEGMIIAVRNIDNYEVTKVN